jgi:hypothetical protein
MSILGRVMLVAALFVPAAMAASPASAAAAPRHYDCSKPGNANKAACKSAPAKASPAVPETRTTTKSTVTKTTERHYDCTKAGNANKAECKAAASKTPTGKTSGAVKTTTKTTSTTYDCTKWYNKMRANCRATTTSTPAKTKVAPAPKPAPAPKSAAAPKATAGSGESVNNNPSGAIAQCKDGTYSHAKTHQGACSRHGGVAKWM